MSFYHKYMPSPSTITIDAAGRLVIPASIRKELALVAGSELSIELVGDEVHLKPAGRAALVERGRLLLVDEPMVGDVVDHRELREDRLTHLETP